ncbi:MAG: hypothetical protein WBG43_00255 [Marinifilaceae bacterium]
MKKTLIQVALWVLIVLFGYLCVMSIVRPTEFNKVKKQRYEKVIQNLKDIRTAQVAYKDANGSYTSSFDTLIDYVKNDSMKFIRAIGSLSDEQLEAGMTEREAVKKGLIFRDTIRIAALDTLFGKDYKIDELRYVPYSNNTEEFKMATGEIKTASGMEIKVFEASVRNFVIFKNILDEYKDEILEFNGEKKRLDKFMGLKVGNVEEANNNVGNWE